MDGDPGTQTATRTIEVFADVTCPFTHVGLRRFVERRESLGRDDVVLRVRAWPLEVVNGSTMDPDFIGEEIDLLRSSVAGDLFGGFTTSAFPGTSMPALAVAAAAYRHDLVTGEAVSLLLRDLLWEKGRDIGSPAVLAEVTDRFSLQVRDIDVEAVYDDHREGVARGVVGSPHFFTPADSYFCPGLDISRNAEGHLVIAPAGLEVEAFLSACFD